MTAELWDRKFIEAAEKRVISTGKIALPVESAIEAPLFDLYLII